MGRGWNREGEREGEGEGEGRERRGPVWLFRFGALGQQNYGHLRLALVMADVNSTITQAVKPMQIWKCSHIKVMIKLKRKKSVFTSAFDFSNTAVSVQL
jgi:hypothetical protein